MDKGAAGAISLRRLSLQAGGNMPEPAGVPEQAEPTVKKPLQDMNAEGESADQRPAAGQHSAASAGAGDGAGDGAGAAEGNPEARIVEVVEEGQAPAQDEVAVQKAGRVTHVETADVIWKRRLSLLVLFLSFFCHIFALSLTVNENYKAAIELQQSHLSRQAKYASGHLRAFLENSPNMSVALDVAKQYLDRQNFNLLVDSHEVTVAKRTDVTPNAFTLEYLNPFKFANECNDGVCSVYNSTSTTSIAMKRALSGRTDVLKGPDYRGVDVLAAHTYVEGFDAGLVYKVDFDEFRWQVDEKIMAVVIINLAVMLVTLTGFYFLFQWMLTRLEGFSRNPEKLQQFRWNMAAIYSMVVLQMVLITIIVSAVSCSMMSDVYIKINTEEQRISAQIMSEMIDMQLQSSSQDAAAVVKLIDELNRQVLEGSSEIVIATNETTDGAIKYLTSHKFADQCANLICGGSGDEAITLALEGKLGTILTTDYRPSDVYASYIYNDALKAAVVLKIDENDVTGEQNAKCGLSAGITFAVTTAIIAFALCAVYLGVQYLETLWKNAARYEPSIIHTTQHVLQGVVFVIYAITAILTIIMVLAVQGHSYYDHHKTNLWIGSEVATTVLGWSQQTDKYTPEEATTKITNWISNFNTHNLPSRDEIEVAQLKGTDDGQFDYLTALKFRALCDVKGCSKEHDEAIKQALLGKNGAMEGNDYRPTDVIATHTWSDAAKTGVVYKRDKTVVSRGYGYIIKMTLLGLACFVVVGGIMLSVALWLGLKWLVPLWGDQSDAAIQKSQGRKTLVLVGVLVLMVVLDAGILSFGIMHPHTVNIEDQEDLITSNLRLAHGMISIMPELFQPNPDQLRSDVASFVNYLNYQVLPPAFELQLGQYNGANKTVMLLTQPKFTTSCPDRVCASNNEAYQGLQNALEGLVGTIYEDDYRPSSTLQTYMPLDIEDTDGTQSSFGLVLKVDTNYMTYTESLRDVYGLAFGGSSMLLVGIAIAAVVVVMKLEFLEAHIRYPKVIEVPKMDKLSKVIIFGLLAIILALTVAFIIVAAATSNLGYEFMLGQTTRDMDAGVQLIKGSLLTAQNRSIDVDAAASFLDFFNYQVLETSYEVSLMKMDGADAKYLTQLKFRSGCDGYYCNANDTSYLASALKGENATDDNARDYRPEPVLAAWSRIDGSNIEGSTDDVAISMKLDRGELRRAWRDNVISICSVVALAMLIVMGVALAIWIAMIMRVVKQEVAFAQLVAQRLMTLDFEGIEFPEDKSLVLEALETIVERLKVYRPYLPEELFSHAMRDQGDGAKRVDANEDMDDPKASLKVNKVSPIPIDHQKVEHAVQLGAIPEASMAVSAAPVDSGLKAKSGAFVCLELFNLDKIRQQQGNQVLCAMHTDICTKVSDAAKQFFGSFHGFDLCRTQSFLSWNTVSHSSGIPAYRACQAALEIRQALEELNVVWLEKHGMKLKYGMAITCGDVAAGDMGTQSYRRFALMGQAVSLLQPYVTLNRVLKSSILADSSVYQICNEGFEMRLVDVVNLANSKILGVDQTASHVYEIIGEKGQSSQYQWNLLSKSKDQAKDHQHFEFAMRNLMAGNMKEAIVSFKRHLEDYSGDHVAEAWVESLTHLQEEATKNGARVSAWQPRVYRDGWAHKTEPSVVHRLKQPSELGPRAAASVPAPTSPQKGPPPATAPPVKPSS